MTSATKLFFSRRLNRFPGDTALEITKPATTDDGRVIPAGTVVQPSSAGMLGAKSYQTVIAIEGPLAGTDGRELTFF